MKDYLVRVSAIVSVDNEEQLNYLMICLRDAGDDSVIAGNPSNDEKHFEVLEYTDEARSGIHTVGNWLEKTLLEDHNPGRLVCAKCGWSKTFTICPQCETLVELKKEQ